LKIAINNFPFPITQNKAYCNNSKSSKERFINNFPFSIGQNEAYCNNFKGGKGRFKSKRYKEYIQEVFYYFMTHSELLRECRKMKALLDSPLHYIQIDHYFYLEENEFFTKKDRKIKQRDIFNLTKVLHDTLSKQIDIPDCYFFAGIIKPVRSNKTFLNLTLEVKLF
jgi:Holliday junction resolvase RusA-like endonuclease